MSKADKEMMDSNRSEVVNDGLYYVIAKNESASTKPTSTASETNEIDNLRGMALPRPTCLSTLTFTPSCWHHLASSKTL
jgi:hypothetical protein